MDNQEPHGVQRHPGGLQDEDADTGVLESCALVCAGTSTQDTDC